MNCFLTARVAPEKAAFRPALPLSSLPGVNGTHMGKMSYSEQLKHPFWQRKRLEVLEAADFSCCNCGDTEMTLHVHHKRYVKGRMAWEYEAHELQALCEPCHALQHEHREVLDRLLMIGIDRLQKAVGLLVGYETAEMNVDFGEEEEGARIGGEAFLAGAVGAMLMNVGPAKAAAAVQSARAGTSLNPAERQLLRRLRELGGQVSE